MKYAICEDCESIVEADVVNVGVGCVGHYFCCNWAHECSVYDLFNDIVEANRHGVARTLIGHNNTNEKEPKE